MSLALYEEEQLNLALAISASLAEQPGSPPSLPQPTSSSSYGQPSVPPNWSGAPPSARTPAAAAANRAPAAPGSTSTPSSSLSLSSLVKPRKEKSQRICSGCGKPLRFLTTQVEVSVCGRPWHRDCVKCKFCGQLLGDGTYVQGDDGDPYHPDCHRDKFHPVCLICGTFIPASMDGRISYKQHMFWKEKYCPMHESDGSTQCCSCSRWRASGEEWVHLTDGRELCLQCLDTIVVDTQDAQPLYDDVLDFYRRLGMPHPYRAPLMLVDAPALNEYSAREGGRADGPVFHVRGLCLAEVYREVPAIWRRSSSGRLTVDVGAVSTPVSRQPGGGGGGSSFSAVTHGRCSVTALLVVYGLPRLLTGCIVAHELMHAWLRMAGVANLDLTVEEGLCQLMALLWLDMQPTGGQEEFQARLSSFLAFQIRTDTSAVYGDGFRAAYEAFQLVGLQALIASVIKSGTLPLAG